MVRTTGRPYGSGETRSGQGGQHGRAADGSGVEQVNQGQQKTDLDNILEDIEDDKLFLVDNGVVIVVVRMLQFQVIGGDNGRHIVIMSTDCHCGQRMRCRKSRVAVEN